MHCGFLISQLLGEQGKAGAEKWPASTEEYPTPAKGCPTPAEGCSDSTASGRNSGERCWNQQEVERGANAEGREPMDGVALKWLDTCILLRGIVRRTREGCRRRWKLKPSNLSDKRVIFETELLKTTVCRDNCKHWE